MLFDPPMWLDGPGVAGITPSTLLDGNFSRVLSRCEDLPCAGPRDAANDAA